MKQKSILLALIANFLTITISAQVIPEYDISAVSPSGHTLYYRSSVVPSSGHYNSSGNFVYYDTILRVWYPRRNSTGTNYYSGYPKPSGNVVIPDSVDGKPVIGFGSNCFYGCNEITSITIPDGVTEVGYQAFRDCSSLVSITLPDGITWIGNGAFFGCSSLASITLPDNVTVIGHSAFGYCSSLTSVTLSNNVTVIEGFAFEYCSSLASINLPNSLIEIGVASFSNCSSLASITLPSGLTEIGGGAFSGCNSLASITLPNGLTEIGTGTFENCSNLVSITLPNELTEIGERTFAGCSNLVSIFIPDSVNIIMDRAFMNCSSLGSIILPDGLTEIMEQAFLNCSSLDTIYSLCIIPPVLGNWVFNHQATVFIPCNTRQDYLTTWDSYGHTFKEPEANIDMTLISDNPEQGSVNIISQNGNYVLCADSSTIISASSNYGYHFFQWSTGSIITPDTLYLKGDSTVTAYFDRNSYHLTAYSSDTVMGTATTVDSTLLYLDTISIAATANYGFHFSHWNDGNTENPRIVQVTCDSVFTALFGYNQYNIVLSADTYYHGTVSGAGVFNYLSEQTITALPSYGYHFTAWNDGDSTNPRIVTLTQDTTLTAMFDRNSYHLTAFSADTVMGAATAIDSTLFYLDTITIAATANYGYHFSQWSDGITENPRALLVTRDSVLSAIFAKNSYSVTVSSADTMMGSTGKTPYENLVYLDSVTLTAYPAYGCHFTQWNDGDTNNPRVIMLTQDTAFVASFGFNQYTVTVQSSDTALGSVTGNGSAVYYHDSIAISAICTAPHHHFVQWNDGCTETPRMITVTCDTLFTAIFAIDTHVVVRSVNDTLMGTIDGPTEAPYGTTVTLTATAEDGYHFGAWSNGAMDNPYTLTVVSDTSVTAFFTADLSPELCMVGVSDWKNQLIWEPLEEPCTTYRLYRESDMAGVYELMAEVPYDSATTFVDSTSRPMTRSYRYRISGVDPYGREGVQSPVHKTMHLTISQGIGNHWNLVWTEYEGADYTTYIIYRGTSQNDLQQIDVMPAGGNTTYTDAEAPAGDVYYQVGVMMTTPCNPTKAATISLSNIATNSTVGIVEVERQGPDVRVYAVNGRIVVEGAEGRGVKVYDVIGREVQLARSLPGGVYLVKVEGLPARKVVVLR